MAHTKGMEEKTKVADTMTSEKILEYAVEITAQFDSWDDAVRKIARILKASGGKITEDVSAYVIPTPGTVRAAIDALDWTLEKFQVNDLPVLKCGHEKCQELVMTVAAVLVTTRCGNWDAIKKDIAFFTGMSVITGGGNVVIMAETLRAARVMLREYKQSKEEKA